MRKPGIASLAAMCFILLSATPAFAGSELPPPGHDVGGVVVQPGAAPGSTAFTGAGPHIMLWMVVAAALFVVGVLLLVASRHRRLTAAP